MTKKKAKKKVEPEQQEVNNLGLIDENTPEGRMFEFERDNPIHIPEKLIYRGVDRTGSDDFNLAAITMEKRDGSPFLIEGDDTIPTVEMWNLDCSPFCEGYTDPQVADVPKEKAKSTVIATDDDVSKIKLDHYEHIIELNVEVVEAKRKYLDAKENATYLNKKYQALSTNLQDLIENSPVLPLFDKTKNEPTPKTESETPKENWRDVTLGSLPYLGNKTLQKLEAHEPSITTLGQFSDWQAKKGDFWAKDIKGIGKKARKEIEDALETYWIAHPQEDSSQ